MIQKKQLTGLRALRSCYVIADEIQINASEGTDSARQIILKTTIHLEFLFPAQLIRMMREHLFAILVVGGLMYFDSFTILLCNFIFHHKFIIL